MHSGVWQDVVRSLIDQYRVTIMDLPGHGLSRPPSVGHTLADLARVVAANAPAEAVWIGWSLGGLISQRLAIDAPERVVKLVLVGSSPCFVRRPAWPCAVEFSVLHQFSEGLERDYRATLKRFLALTVQDSENATIQLRRLREIFSRHSEPDITALRSGLSILENEDLRGALGGVSCPALLVIGQEDNFVPVSAAMATRDLLPDARLQVFERAGHAPFLSHLNEFVECLRDFLDE